MRRNFGRTAIKLFLKLLMY